jgi:hypothetical protein
MVGNMGFDCVEISNRVHNTGRALIDPPRKIRDQLWTQGHLDRRPIGLDRSPDLSVEEISLRRTLWIDRPSPHLFQINRKLAEQIVLDDAWHANRNFCGHATLA